MKEATIAELDVLRTLLPALRIDELKGFEFRERVKNVIAVIVGNLTRKGHGEYQIGLKLCTILDSKDLERA